METEQSASINEKSDEEIANENEERKEKRKERNREYQRAWRQRQKDLKKKVLKEEKEEKKRKRHRENQRAYYHRKKGLKENDKNVEKLFQKKLDDLQMKRKKLDGNEDQENVVQCRAFPNLENVQLEQNQFLTQQLHIYEESQECITSKVILHRNTDIPGVHTSNVEPQIKEEREEHDDHLETDIPPFRINIELEHEDKIKEEITIEENNFHCRICLSVGRRMSPLEEYEEIYKKLLFDNYQDQGYDEYSYLYSSSHRMSMREEKTSQMKVVLANEGLFAELNYLIQEENWFSTVQVCWECHAVLRSVDRFQRKVRTAHDMLQSQQNDVSLSTLTTVVFSDSHPDTIYLIDTDKQTDQLNSETDRDENPENNELLIEREKLKDTLTRKRKIVKRKPKFKVIEDVETFKRVDFDLNGLKEVLDERRNEESYKRSRFRCSTCILSFDDENELSEHNRECHDEAKKKKKKVSKAKTKLEKEYEGKIRLVMLTMEEMLEERRAEALKNNYLKFPYKCEYCITGFDHELALKSHMETRHSKKSDGIECKICNSILGTKISFNEHHKRHFRRYECIECGRRNNYLYSVLKHYNEKHGRIKTVFRCELCDFSTESHRVYRYHRDKHRRKKVECQVCGNTFVTKNGLNTHMFTVHGQSRRVYSCAECGKQYRAKSGLWAHAAAHAPSPASCLECDAHFTSQLGLKSHLKRHSKHNERRFACNECDAIFIVKKSLQDHIDLMHLNNTEHACNKCNKVFINSASLKTHKEIIHENKRPPRNKICDYCGRGFTSLSILRSHIRTHTATGERPLHCTHCTATFAHSTALYTHNKLEHSKT